MYGKTRRRLPCLLFSLRRFRRLSRLYRVTLPAVVFQLFVVKEQRLQRLTHMPLDIVGQQANQEVSPDPRLDAMVNGTDAQIHSFEAAEGLLDQCQTLVGAYTGSGFQGFLGLAGADHIKPVQLLLALNRRLVPGPGERTIRNAELEMLGHLVATDDLSRFQANLHGRQRLFRSPSHFGDQFAEVVLGGLEKSVPLVSAALGQERVVTDNQTFAGVIGRGDLREVDPVEKGAHQDALLQQLLDRLAAQG